jgi:hypothetical protein
MTTTNSTVSSTVTATGANAPPVVTKATTRASNVHAVTSSTAAQVRAIEPIGVSSIFRSARMRASTGNCRDAHRDAHEQCERTKRRARWRVSRVEHECRAGAEKKRHKMLT